MRALDDPLAASAAQGMIRHHSARMTDDDAAAQHHDLDALPDWTLSPISRQGTE